MSLETDTLREEGLRFFGKMNASLSHEIRNSMAVINENAGLIRDLLLMAEKRGPADLGRIDSLAQRISEQIRRANGIVDNMNKFAHSVDDSVRAVDVIGCLRLVTELSGRFAAMRGVGLHLEESSAPLEITTSPFLLQNLISLCLERAMDATPEGGTVSMKVEQEGGCACIRFSGMKSVGEKWTERPPSKAEEEIFRSLDARLEFEVQPPCVKLLVSDHD